MKYIQATIAAAIITVTAVHSALATDTQIEVANKMIQELNYLEQLARQGKRNANLNAHHAINFAEVEADIARLRQLLSTAVTADWQHGRRRQLDQNPVQTEVAR